MIISKVLAELAGTISALDVSECPGYVVILNEGKFQVSHRKLIPAGTAVYFTISEIMIRHGATTRQWTQLEKEIIRELNKQGEN